MLCLLPTSAHAIGEWTVYNAVPDISRIEFFDDRVYAMAGASLVSFSPDTLDFDYHQLAKVDGLSGNHVSFITTSETAECLVVVYEDCNIDLIFKGGETHCIPDIANKAMAGDKAINSILESDGKLYVSCSFGILVVDLLQHYIPVSSYTSYPISISFEYADNLYRYSDKRGLEYCSTSQNVADNKNWHTISNVRLTDAAIISGQKGSHCWLISDKGQLLELSSPSAINTLSDGPYTSIHRLRQSAMLTAKDRIVLAAPLNEGDRPTASFTPNVASPMCYCIDFTTGPAENDVYMLYTDNAIYHSSISNYVPGTVISFDMDFKNVMKATGLITAYLGDMTCVEGGVLGISRRSYTTSMTKANALPGVISTYSFEDEEWNSLNTFEAICSRLTDRTSFQGLSGLAVDPTQPDRYAISAYMHGLYIIDHDTLLYRYDDLTSPGIVDAFGKDFLSARVSSVAYDDEGNLFFANSMQDTVLRCLTPQGKCIKYPNDGFTQVSDANRILISRHHDRHFKWVLNDYGYQKSRVGIYDDHSNPVFAASKNNTDKYSTAWFTTLVDQDNNEYLPYYIYDLVEDLEGKVWVLTNLGPFAIDDPQATFEFAQKNPGQGKVRRIKIPRNDGTNLADYLMESTTCSCMAIDNFNRKWIGTQGAGLYLMSADCITTVEHFTTENSPLLSDNILSLCYDNTSGLLFISCESGVITYQTDAIEGNSDFSSIYCYPNPIRPEYSGELRIMGLMNDSQVSITTASGDLIYRTTSQGVTATWDLHTAYGARVEPGIYLIHGVSSAQKKGTICKFLVL